MRLNWTFTLIVLSCFHECQAQSGAELFNPAALLIVFREVLEACIIISVMLNALHQVGGESKKKWVWYGAGLGLFVSLVLAVAFVASFWVASQNVFTGYNKSVFQGIFSTFAAVMVTFVAFKMLKFSGLEAKWSAKLRSRGAAALDLKKGGLSPEELDEITGSNTSIFLVIFSTVVREGLETAVFIGGVGAASWRSIPLPAFVGVALGLLVGLLIVKGGRKVENLAWFFYASCVFLLFVAAGFTNYAASEFESIFTEDAMQDGNLVIGNPLWNLRYCCDEMENGFFAIFKAIFGWRDSPTLVVALVYLSYWLVVTCLLWYKFATGRLFQSKWTEAAQETEISESVQLPEVTAPQADSAEAAALPAAADEAGPKTLGSGSASAEEELRMHSSTSLVLIGRGFGIDEEVAGPTKPPAAAHAPAPSTLRWHLFFAAVQLMLWSFVIAVSCVAGLRASKGVRLYYIAATEVDWDYAPSGMNGLTSRSFMDPAEADAARYMVHDEKKYLGRKLKKVRFVEYTDKSFATAKAVDPQWAHKGILGPVIRAEVGDAIRVVFRNMDTERQYSINARGVFYGKADEGVRYTDGSRRRRLLWSRDSGSMALSGGGGVNKLDDAIEPQTTFVYNWNVPERSGPGPADPSSVVWTYQSMADGEFDLFTGLIGPIIITRKGMGGPDRKPIDVDREVIAFFVNFNEDESHKRDANIAKLTPMCGTPGHEECHYADEDVFDSQQKRAINGYMYDNIPDMTMLVGERVRWYLLAMGNEADLHSIFWQGQTVLHRGHRKQSIEMIAGSAYTVDMVPDLAGRFQFGCGIDEHFKGGMVGSFRVQSSVGAAGAGAALGGVMRSYYIAAVERQWDYAPTGTDTIAPVHGDSALSALSMDAEAALAKTTYKKVVFVEFTDATFTVEKAVPPEWAHKGIMGPVLRAEVGDTLAVTLRNDGPQACSIRPHGLNHMAGEGFAFAGGYQANQADVVQPGATHTYSFEVPERSGPGTGDGSSVAWLYYSDVDHTLDINTGLVGGIVVTRKGSADAAGKPKDVDKEFFALFNIFDEGRSWFSGDADYTGVEHQKSTINGYIFGNNEAFQMRVGDRVRWYLFAVGGETGLHTPHFHAATVLEYGRRTDVTQLLPTSTMAVDMVPNSVGEWMLHCHVSAHMMRGMIVTYHVAGPDDSNKLDALDGGAARKYFVACEEVEWNYGPSGRNGVTDTLFDSDRSATYMAHNDTRIGATNRKARYIEYTDDSFATVREPSADWRHKGILGPVLRAEVGDQIHVLFRNKCTRPFTMHPHGVEYLKDSEGADYADGVATSAKPGSGVAPGASFLYKWKATERSGPGPSDLDTVPWLYHSHVDEGRDVASGLLGLILVSKKGAGGVEDGRRVGRPPSVDRELVVLFKVFDESASWYLEHNVESYTKGVAAVKARCTADGEEAEEEAPYCEAFAESNMKHAINGYMFDNNPYLTMKMGQRVRWYVLDLGTEVDMHGAIWNGNTVLQQGSRRDQLELMPASMQTAEMVVDNPGRWMFKCQVTDHSLAGMVATYRVE